MSGDIEIEIGAGSGAGNYIVRVVSALSGGEPTSTLQLDVEELLSRRALMETTVLASAVAARRSVPATEQPVREVGQQLFEALFPAGPVNSTYRSSLGMARQRGTRLRVVLRLTAPELAALPWETLFDPETETYLCRQEPLVRHVPAPHTLGPLPVSPPLRILGLVASPRGLDPLDVDAEMDRLAEALAEPVAEGLVEVVWVPQATWEGVHTRLLAGEWHVMHFVGHGDYDAGTDEGVLAMVGNDGRADLIEASRLADLLGEAQPTPRLVVLNSCASGQSGAQDLFSGTAAALARSGISAVAAMQFAVSDTAAIAFARGFYTAIAHGRPVDAAARSGRISILGIPHSLEWVTPVLYVRGDVSQLFALSPPSLGPASAAGRVPATEPSRAGDEAAGAGDNTYRPGDRDPTSPPAAAAGAPLTRIVAPSGGHYTTIAAAITASAAGDRILIRPGEYDESLIIDKDLDIRGDGRAEQITVRSVDAPVISLRAGRAQISNLTIRRPTAEGTQLEADALTGAVQIEGGQPVVRDCDISSRVGSGILIQGNAAPVVRANRIHGNKHAGVSVVDQGRGTFEGNDISVNAFNGVAVASGADPVVRTNRVHDNKQSGVYVFDQGRGTFEDNDIFANALNGVAVASGADPVVRTNRVHDNKQSGVYVFDQGRGTFEDNDISANTRNGVRVQSRGDPTVHANRIHHNKHAGVSVDSGGGTFAGNDISVNAFNGVAVASGADPVVRTNRVHDNKQSGVYVFDQGRGTFEDNDIFANALNGVAVASGADPVVRTNRVHDNKQSGVYVFDQGRGTFEDNDISANTRNGVRVQSRGDPTVHANRIHDNKLSGVYVFDQGRGRFEDNDISPATDGGIQVTTRGDPIILNNTIH